MVSTVAMAGIKKWNAFVKLCEVVQYFVYRYFQSLLCLYYLWSK